MPFDTSILIRERHMNRQELNSIVDAIVNEYGFVRKDNKCYFENDHVIITIDIVRSDNDSGYYLDCNFKTRESEHNEYLRPECEHGLNLKLYGYYNAGEYCSIFDDIIRKNILHVS